MRRTIEIALGTVAALAGVAGTAVAATPHAGARHFTEVEAGVQLSATGNRFEDTFKIKGGPFGGGAAIRDAVLSGNRFPVTGHETAVSYYRAGRQFANETITLGVPFTDGTGPVTGTGTCQGGSGAFVKATCTYKITGTYDLLTGRMFLTLRGTFMPASTKK